MLDDVLVDGLDERVVGDCLDEDGAVVVFGRGGDVDLECEFALALYHLVVNVLDGLEPRHAFVVDVVGFIVEDGEFVDLADDFTEVGFRVGGFADGLGAEDVIEEIVAEIVIIERWLRDVAEEDAVDVGKEEVSGRAQDADVVLNVKGELEVVAPIATGGSVFRENWIVEEDFKAIEVSTEAIEDDDVGSNE